MMIPINEIIGNHSRFEQFERGDRLPAFFLRPCQLKILMVVDGYPGTFLNVSYSHSYFGLSAVLDTLRENPEHYAKFNVTRAHRQTDSFKPDPVLDPDLNAKYGPHHENFRFDQAGFNLDEYDQVWIFGARDNPNDSDRLTDNELEVLARWMDNGGGLFATGDHADLGASLCSRVPRASTMRKWTNAQGVPSAGGLNRHDTLVKGADSFYTFDDESDITPMKTTYKKYHLNTWSPVFRRHAPHPILCGKDGVINILPDHPHEGEVIADGDIDHTSTFSFGAYTNKDEYPTVSSVQAKPEVIAWAHVLGDHSSTTDLNKGAVNSKTFGAIGAYDGHLSNVGRVVVDSTWHHWFDVNLTGRPVSRLDSAPFNSTNPKTEGFEYNTQGIKELSRIQNYFRNVALWLANEQDQRCMFLRAIWGTIIRYPLVEEVHSRLTLWDLGQTARDAIGRRASQCTVTRWVFDLFPIELIHQWERIPGPDPFPCLSCPPIESLEILTLGGIVREMVDAMPELYSNKASKPDETMLANCLVKGAQQGIKALLESQEKSMKTTSELLAELQQSTKKIPSSKAFIDTRGKGNEKSKSHKTKEDKAVPA